MKMLSQYDDIKVIIRITELGDDCSQNCYLGLNRRFYGRKFRLTGCKSSVFIVRHFVQQLRYRIAAQRNFRP